MQSIMGFTETELGALAAAGNQAFNQIYLAKMSAEDRLNVRRMKDDRLLLRCFLKEKYLDTRWHCAGTAVDTTLPQPPSQQAAVSTSTNALTSTATGSPSWPAGRTPHSAVTAAVAHSIPSPVPQRTLPSNSHPIAAASNSPGAVYAVRVGADDTAYRAVRVSTAFARRKNYPVTEAAYVCADDSEQLEVVDVAEPIIVAPLSGHLRLLSSASCSPIGTAVSSLVGDCPLIDLSNEGTSNQPQRFTSSSPLASVRGGTQPDFLTS